MITPTLQQALDISQPLIKKFAQFKQIKHDDFNQLLSKQQISKQLLENALLQVGLCLGDNKESIYLEPTPELLDKQLILPSCLAQNPQFDSELHVLWSVGSTNDIAKDKYVDDSLEGRSHIVVCEHQQSGRGRRGNQWVSPLGRNIYFSIAHKMPHLNAPLSLETASVVISAFEKLDIHELQIKWPNDIVVNDQKIGGILVEVQHINNTPTVIIGIGINLAHSEAITIDQPWSDVMTIANKQVNRNALVAQLAVNMHDMLSHWSRETSRDRLTKWQQKNRDQGRYVKLLKDGMIIADGICRGIDSDGKLLLESDGDISSYVIGEVSLRQ